MVYYKKIVLLIMITIGCILSFTAHALDYLVISPMPIESGYLEKFIKNRQEYHFNSYRYISGMIDHKSVMIANTGIGKTNVTLSTVWLINHYHPKKIIVYGTAGGEQKYHIGDIMVVTKTADADLGKVTTKGIVLPKFVNAAAYGYAKPIIINLSISLELKNLIQKSKNTYFGYSATSDNLPSNLKKIEMLEQLGFNIFDMEDSSVAYVAKSFNIPIIIIRSISDTAKSGFTHHGFNVAAKNSSALALKVIKNEI